MHLLAAQPGGFVDDASVITRLDQTPADIVILSAADTTLSLLAANYVLLQEQLVGKSMTLPSLRLANLLHLRQPASVDLYLDEVLQHARIIIIDHLGGESYWPYGTAQVVELCRDRRIELAMFSGDTTEDTNLLMKSTVPMKVGRTLWRYLREGGAENARQMFLYIAANFFSLPAQVMPPKPLPGVSIFHPASDVATLENWQQEWLDDAPVVILLFYRAHVQSGNTKVFTYLCESLQGRGLNPLPVALLSLKDKLCLETLQQLGRTAKASLILNTTAFSLGNINDAEQVTLLDDVPVLQLILSGGNEQSWRDDPHGLQPRDIAMHIALPEVDGRIITRAVSFKGLDYRCEITQTDVVQYQPQVDRIAFVSELAQRWCRLRTLPNSKKRLALILANYPVRDDRMGNGVGLDTPASVISILERLQQEGYQLDTIPDDGNQLMQALRKGITNDPDQWPLRPAFQSMALADYQTLFEQLPQANRQAIVERWGLPEQDPMLRQQRFMIAGLRCGNVFIGVQPSRGYNLDLMANYHDPDLVPPHAYLAFYFWLRQCWQTDAMVHVGKHGNLEWLPGKSVALSDICWPDLIFGPMPHLYPFIVNDPGEGAQAKRRTQAVIIDHLMPPLTRAENYGPVQDLERLVDEYYDALSLDLNRASLLRKKILAMIVQQNLHRDLGLPEPATEEQEQQLLNSTDAYLCELKESQIRDGLHIFGQSPRGDQLRDTLLALARYPVLYGKGADNSLLRAMAADLALDFDPLDASWNEPWSGPFPDLLQQITDAPWRTCGDTRERLEMLALKLLQQQLEHQRTEIPSSWSATTAVFERILGQLLPSLNACGPQELEQLLRGLSGRFVPPGPSGAPSRGRPDVLPTGRNFYSVDTRAIPTPTAWQIGAKSAMSLIEKYVQENGDFPKAIGLSVWGTATMRTGGDDIAQAFALIGVKPRWANGSHRVMDFEILPMSLLDRPRIDVTLRVSGFFRDAFTNVIRLFDAAVQAVAELDEPEDVNPIRVRIQRETQALIQKGVPEAQASRQASYRVFGSKPGAYGVGLQGLIDNRQWDSDADLANTYLNWSGYAYGQKEYGVSATAALEQRLQEVELVLQNQDNREHDILDSDDYYQFQGGMALVVRHLSQKQPQVYLGDHSNPEAPRIYSLDQEVSRVMRARVTNPKWIDGVKRHGYKGAFEMAATVDFLFGWDATARVVRDDQYAAVTDAYVNDPQTRDFIRQNNPGALQSICERLLEAIQRGLWQQPDNYQEQLQQHLLSIEQHLEGA